ncbi:MAG: hypothetical protein HRT36_00650 [Alphaproteobacteria bacterium]|nr:hypothetical protein [Alphaproteobacteria bacterium]
MKGSKFGDIVLILEHAKNGVPVSELCRDHAAKLYTEHTGQCWMSAQTSKSNCQAQNGAGL